MKKRICAIISIFFIFSTFFFGEAFNASNKENLSGKALSDHVYARISAQKPDAAKSLLYPQSDDFPYNIEFSYQASDTAEEKLHTIILDFTQEDIFKHISFLEKLMKLLSSEKLPYDVHIVITAGDEHKVPGNKETEGSDIFCDGLEGSDNISAVTVGFREKKKTKIIPGACRKVSPEYIAKPLAYSLIQNDIDFHFQGGLFLTLYQFGLFGSDGRLENFLEKDIPAIALSFCSYAAGDFETEEKYLCAINAFINKLSPSDAQWSRHYAPVKFGGKIFWANEKMLLGFLLLLTFVSLFLISDFSFILHQRISRGTFYRINALRSLYLIPVTFILEILTLSMAQGITYFIFARFVSSAEMLFGIKMVLAFLFISSFFIIEIKFHKAVPYVYEYILIIMTTLNIFIFSAFEISLCILFAAEYIILQVSRSVKKSISLYIFMVLYLIPFMPLIFMILLSLSGDEIRALVFCSAKDNMIFACALIPFVLMWLRILARFKSDSKSRLKIISSYAKGAISCITAIIIFGFASEMFFRFIVYKTEGNHAKPVPVTASKQNIFSSVNVYDTAYYSGIIRHIELSASRPMERCAVFIKGKSKNPVYYTGLGTETHPDGTVEFLIPDNPPESFSITYSPDRNAQCVLFIEFYFYDSEKSVFKKELHEFEIEGEIIVEREPENSERAQNGI